MQGAVDFLLWLNSSKYVVCIYHLPGLFRPADVKMGDLFKEFVDQRTMVDMVAPKVIEVIIEKDRVWINNELHCVFRAQNIQTLKVEDKR